jgi:hypothetical protein
MDFVTRRGIWYEAVLVACQVADQEAVEVAWEVACLVPPEVAWWVIWKAMRQAMGEAQEGFERD